MPLPGSRPRISTLGVLVAVLTSLLISAGSAQAAGRCGQHPWCDTSLTPDVRAALVVRELTLREKVSLMAGDDTSGVTNTVPNPQTGEIHTGTSLGIPRLDIPTVFFSDGPVGPRQGQATPLPSAMGLAATFDPAIARRHGGVVGAEARAKGNDFVLGPTMNIMRTPKGGRTFEGYGEDPLLTGSIAVGWIRGLQAQGVVGNAKHYALNNQEGQRDQPVSNRFFTNAIADERTIREIYTPHFERVVRDADVGTIMGSYNAINGEPATQNRHLLLDILKGDFGFDGFVLTDYEAQRSTDAAANNGLDLELPQAQFFKEENLEASVAARRISTDTIDEHVRRLLRVYFKYGLLDRDDYPNGEPTEAERAAHNADTREIEEASATLLKNDGVLPVDPGKVKSIALIGPDAETYKSGGGSSNIDPFTPPITPCQGLKERGAAAGVQVTCESASSPAAGAAAARGKDLAIVIASDSQSEFLDKACIDLRDDCDSPPNDAGDQLGRIREVKAANPNTMVLLETGGPVLLPFADDVRAILQAWYPGQEGGRAIARVLFGDVDPGGRLPVTFPEKAADLPTEGDAARYPGIGPDARYSEGVFVGYRHFDERGLAPRYAFGHGLSYTSFRYENLRVSREASSPRATVSVDVVNTGTRRGTETPQLYLGLPDPASDVPQPPRQLKGFEKLDLAPGARRTVTFELDGRAFSYWDTPLDDWRVAPGCYAVEVGRSSRAIEQRGTISQGGASCGPGAAGGGPDAARGTGAGGAGAGPGGPGAPGTSPAACRATSGFSGAVTARPAGRGLRIASSPRGGGAVRIDLFRISQGRRVLRERRVARFSSRSGDARYSGRGARDGYYFARVRNGADVRRITLRRARGRFRVVTPGFYRRATCDLLPSFKLERAVFGGTGRRPLRISYRLARTARVTVTVSRGARVVKRFRSRTNLASRTIRLKVPLRGLRPGSYRVRLTAVTAGGERVSSTLGAQRLR